MNLSSCNQLKPESYTLAFLLVVFLLAGCSRSDNGFNANGMVMGTSYSVQIVAMPKAVDRDKLSGSIAEVLNAVDARMSTYKPESELSVLNGSDIAVPQALSRQLANVLALALDVHQQSEGAFDVTVGPLVQLWGFGSRSTNQVRPAKEDLKAVLDSIGSQALTLDQDKLQLSRSKAVEIDLSAIAKGFAVDELANYLKSKGIEHFLVEVGGELRASGLNKRGHLWLVGIEKPDAAPGNALGAVPLRDVAIATSGDYRNYFEEEGVRYSHTIDPRTGQPVTHQLASVSVLHASAALADAWATALNVLGPDQGLAIANKLDLQAFFVIRKSKPEQENSADEFVTHASDAYNAYNESI